MFFLSAIYNWHLVKHWDAPIHELHCALFNFRASRQLCFTTDNATNLINAAERLQCSHRSCFGHNMHLALTSSQSWSPMWMNSSSVLQNKSVYFRWAGSGRGILLKYTWISSYHSTLLRRTVLPDVSPDCPTVLLCNVFQLMPKILATLVLLNPIVVAWLTSSKSTSTST